MTRQEAIKASRNGAIAAFISGGATLIFAIAAIGFNLKGDFELWNDPLIFVDVILIFTCAYFMLRNSRAAAVTIFIYFIVAKIAIGLTTEFGLNAPGIWISLVFLYYFGTAIQGSFAYHRIEKTENSHFKPTPKSVYFD